MGVDWFCCRVGSNTAYYLPNNKNKMKNKLDGVLKDKNGVPRKIKVNVYYTIDEVGIITLDEEGIQDEFDGKLDDLVDMVYKINTKK
jgi:hypothetical protein